MDRPCLLPDTQPTLLPGHVRGQNKVPKQIRVVLDSLNPLFSHYPSLWGQDDGGESRHLPRQCVCECLPTGTSSCPTGWQRLAAVRVADSTAWKCPPGRKPRTPTHEAAPRGQCRSPGSQATICGAVCFAGGHPGAGTVLPKTSQPPTPWEGEMRGKSQLAMVVSQGDCFWVFVVVYFSISEQGSQD